MLARFLEFDNITKKPFSCCSSLREERVQYISWRKLIIRSRTRIAIPGHSDPIHPKTTSFVTTTQEINNDALGRHKNYRSTHVIHNCKAKVVFFDVTACKFVVHVSLIRTLKSPADNHEFQRLKLESVQDSALSNKKKASCGQLNQHVVKY